MHPSFTRRRLADSLRRLDDAALWRLLRQLCAAELRQMHDWFGLKDCGCEVGRGLVIASCGCAGPCDCPVMSRASCPHTPAADDCVLPAWAQTWLLWRLWPEDYAEPPPPEAYSRVRRKERMALVMDRRQAAGTGLRHRGDFLSLDLGAVDDRLGRPITRGLDGRDRIGLMGVAHGDADGQGNEGAGAAGEPHRGGPGAGRADRPGSLPRPGIAA